MGSFYVGFDYKNRVNGYFKIGETSKSSPAQRLAQIRQTDCFQCLGYLVLKNETKSQRLFIESYVRMMLEQNVSELTHTQNDHYTYRITSKDEKYPQAWKFAEIALTFAEDACRMSNVEFERGKKVFKRG